MSRSTRIYIGNLPENTTSIEVEDLFKKYGRIRNLNLKERHGSNFAFIEFDDPRDAEDAIDGRDRYTFDGRKLIVEYSKDSSHYNNRDRPPHRYISESKPFYRRPPPKRCINQVYISGLPHGASWQDVKDHMRKAGEVSFADSFNDGTGVVEYLRRDDMKHAVSKLNRTLFRSHRGDTSEIIVSLEDKNRSRSRSRSPYYEERRDRRRYSRSYSRSRSRSRSCERYVKRKSLY